ncbi:MAG: hypothetical protein CMJ89_07425 [Planctomycetes bacterium]|nr:hypothetical protein [Planctomycetota bacterium]
MAPREIVGDNARVTRLTTLLTLIAAVACRPSTPLEGARPNIVFILADDLGWADVGYQGSSFHTTPRIDALARSGMVFSNSYASSPVCSPTRLSFLTGQNPARHGMTKALHPGVMGGQRGTPVDGPQENEWWEPILQDHLPSSETTIAERLRDGGYRTGLIGKWHLGEPLADEHGFDVTIGTAKLAGPATYFSPYGLGTLPDGPEGEYLTDRITLEAVKFIKESRGRPFFLYLSHFAPHSPWEAKAELIEKHQGRVDPDALQKNPIYAAMIESLDDSVGRIVATLEELGIAGDTLLIFTSDNGALTERWLRRKSKHRTLFEITSNAPLRGGKGKLYEGGLRVPTIVSWPGVIEAGTRCDVPIITTDFYPTFLALAGLPRGDQILDGVDITPLLEGKTSLERDALYFHFPHQTLACGMRKGDEKLVHFFDGRTELYDLGDDPGEENDLAAARSVRAGELKGELFDWLEGIGAVLPVRNPAF